MTLLFGLAALAILLWAAQKYLQADPRKLAAVLKLSGGIALLTFAAFLGLRGPSSALAKPQSVFATVRSKKRPSGCVNFRNRCR